MHAIFTILFVSSWLTAKINSEWNIEGSSSVTEGKWSEPSIQAVVVTLDRVTSEVESQGKIRQPPAQHCLVLKTNLVLLMCFQRAGCLF